MSPLIAASNAINRTLERFAFASGWLLVVLMVVTCFDVVGRKLRLPIPLTQFQELEWHLSTTVFAMWLGYNYTINAHPRVDSYTETLGHRAKAWVEFVGVVLFAIPYTMVILYFGWDFVKVSFLQMEGSENVVGLPWRWVLKSIFYLGLLMLLAAIVSVLMRLVAYLFLGRPAEEAQLPIGHSELEV